MPFPWTKSSVTRISQLVADLNSPKRAGSLVVHTGFPTSLIDLVVKNRRRFRKSKSKKPGRPEISPPVEPTLSGFTAICADPVQEDGPLKPGRPESFHLPLPPKLPETPSSTSFTTVHADGVSNSGPESGGSGSKSVLAAVLTMLTVVPLVVSVENLAVAITVSAFALLFLEKVGKRVVSFSNGNVGVLNFLTRRIQWKNKKGCEGPEPANVEGDSIVVSESGSESDEVLSCDEIEVVEFKSEDSVCSDETCFAGSELDYCGSEDKKRGCSETLEDSISSETFVGSSCKGNRSGKLKSKMKKLLSKKLGSFRKEGKERKSTKASEAEAIREVSCTVKNHSFEMEEDKKDECVTENDVDHAGTSSQECSLTVTGEGKRIDGVGNSGHIIILFLIALFGLLVGRLAALVLTMTWCLMLKIVATRGRWKVPLIKCSVPRS